MSRKTEFWGLIMTVNDMLKSAKEGNADSKQLMYYRYTYIADKFYNRYKDYLTKQQTYDIYDSLFNQYLMIDYPFGLSFYLHKKFYTAIKKYIPAKVLLSELGKNAIKGDTESREELINHYSSIILTKAQEYDYLEYDDLVQYGMIKLIEIIDSHVEHGNTEPLAVHIARSIDAYFNNTLRNEVINYNNNIVDDNNYTSNEISRLLDEKEYVHSISKMEIDDLIRSANLTKKQKVYALKYFVEGLSICEIGNEYGCSKQTVAEKVGYARKRLRNNFKVK